MAQRLKARLSAGAALLTGVGMMGIASAAPAQAATTSLDYTCTYDVLNLGNVPGDSAVKVDLTVDLPTDAKVGDTFASDVTATVHIPDSRRDSLYSLLGIREVDGPDAATAAADDLNTRDARNQAAFTVSNGTDSLNGNIPLSFPKTAVPASGELVVDATGAVEEVELTDEGTFTVTAGDFQAYVRSYGADGGYRTNIAMNCKAPEDAAIGTVKVGPADAPAPEANDWFTEPSSLPITDDEKHFTVKGTSKQSGTIQVVLLDGNKKVLRTDEWSVNEGSNSKDFAFAEGTDYVRIISEDCVDADGNDESAVGSGCNVEYYAPWSGPGSDSGDDAAKPGAPEVPAVVQTDGLTRTAAAEEDNTVAIALGGLLLAGAGAGAVVVARRRAGAEL